MGHPLLVHHCCTQLVHTKHSQNTCVPLGGGVLQHQCPQSYLKVLPHVNTNILGQGKCARICHPTKHESCSHRQVKGVVGSLVGHDAHVCGEGVSREIHLRGEVLVGGGRDVLRGAGMFWAEEAWGKEECTPKIHKEDMGFQETFV